MLSGNHSWYQSVITCGYGKQYDVGMSYPSERMGLYLFEHFLLFPQDLEFQSVAGETCPREGGCSCFNQRNCFAFMVEPKGCGECGGKPKSNSSACIYAKMIS